MPESKLSLPAGQAGLPAGRLFLIDAHALCYRSYFAIKGLTTSTGQATNAVYGFLNTLRKILRDYQPHYMAVCFDAGKKTIRQQKFAQYKINRPVMPNELISQIPLIKEVVAAYHLPIFELDGFEADDLIATLAKRAQSKGLEVVIVSDDKDMLQLINNHIKMFSVRKDMIFGSKEAREIFGIDPHHITDYIALAGDQTDNIPGVIGIGEVTARNLINEFGSLENIFKNLEQIKLPKVKEKLTEQKQSAILCKELAILDSDAPIDIDLKSLIVGLPNNKRLFELYKELEFKKFAEELSEEVAPTEKITVKILRKPEEVKTLVKEIKEKKEFSFLLIPQTELEGGGTNGLTISLGGREVYSVGLELISGLKEVFEDLKIIKISHDIKNALKVLVDQGTPPKGKIFDVMLAGYLISPSQGAYDIGSLAWQFLKSSIPVENKLARETQIIFNMYSQMATELKEKSLLKLFEEIEIPLAYVLYRMESEGVNIDRALLKELSQETERKVTQLMGQLYELAGGEFNLNSPKQLSHVLFEKLKLPVIKKTKTGYSTDEDVLTKLAPKHPIPALILEYRQLTKLKNTYIDALPKLIDPKTGFVHASFNQTGTETGRLSSNNPNLQNIPIRTELGRQIRKAFIPLKKGHLIISADYSQIELRILAHLSQDENLMKAFQNDQDIHVFTAALIFDVKESEVTPQMRNSAKRVNFGIIYGMSAFGLAKDLEISQKEAQEFIDKYFLRYPDVKKFMDDEIKIAEEKGFVLTLLNRRRYLPEINSPNQSIKQFAQRQAINTPVQGSAADLIKLSMINIQEELEKRKLGTRMIITVHDELVFDVPAEEKNFMVGLIRDKMENSVKLTVPVKATVKAGPNWLDQMTV